jgi:hypothetical protein
MSETRIAMLQSIQTYLESDVLYSWIRQLESDVRNLNCNATEHTNIPGVRCQKLKSTDIGLGGSMYQVTNNHT